MPILLTCPAGHPLKVPDEWAGRAGRCPACKALVQVPARPAAPPIKRPPASRPAAAEPATVPPVATPGRPPEGKATVEQPAARPSAPAASSSTATASSGPSRMTPALPNTAKLWRTNSSAGSTPAATTEVRRQKTDTPAPPRSTSPARDALAPAIPPAPESQQKKPDPAGGDDELFLTVIAREPPLAPPVKQVLVLDESVAVAPPRSSRDPVALAVPDSAGGPARAPSQETGPSVANAIVPATTAAEPPEKQSSASAAATSPSSAPKARAASAQHAGYEPDVDKRWTVYYLATAMALFSVFCMLPALGYWNLGSAPAWARAVLLLSLLQLAYVVWVVSVPDWSTLWVSMIVFTIVAALYGIAMTVALTTPLDQNQNMLLEMADIRSKAPLWCGGVVLLAFLLAYFCGRAAARWRRSFELLHA